jgi:hypothetical protein
MQICAVSFFLETGSLALATLTLWCLFREHCRCCLLCYEQTHKLVSPQKDKVLL